MDGSCDQRGSYKENERHRHKIRKKTLENTRRHSEERELRNVNIHKL